MGKRKQDAPEENKRKSHADAFVHVFSKNDPCNSRSRDSFEIQQQGGGASGGFKQPQQQKNWSGHTACEDGPGQPRQVFSRKSGLSLPNAGGSVDHAQDGKSDARTKIEQTCNQHRTGGQHGKLGQRCAGSEKQCCSERARNAVVPTRFHGALFLP